MTRFRVSIGASLLVAGVVVPRAGRAQDPDQPAQQQQPEQQLQLESQQGQIQQQKTQPAVDQPQTIVVPVNSLGRGVVIVEHLQLGTQRFEPSVPGFRAYLESIKFSDPNLYRQLAPDVARLETRQDAAKAVAVGGIVVGLASVIYGLAGGETCTQPQVTDPHFSADAQAWSDCNDRNLTKGATFTFLGAGAIVLGGAIAFAMWPRHQELLDLVNKNNRLSKQPLQWNVGYDPTQRFAFSGATVSF